MQVFIARGQEQHGPYPLEQIKDLLAKGVLKSSDYAYHEGLSGWKPLSEIIAAQPEPAASPAKVISPSPSVAPSLKATSAPESKSNAPLIIGIVAGLFILVGLTAAVGLYFLLRDKPPDLAEISMPEYTVESHKMSNETSAPPPLPTNPSTFTSGLPAVDPDSSLGNPEPAPLHEPTVGKLDPKLVAQGKTLFQTKICFTCHQTDPAVPAPAGLALKATKFIGDFWGKEREVLLDADPATPTFEPGGRTVKVKLDDIYFLESVEKPMAKIVKGAIPGMAPLPTTPEERKALLAYVKSLGKKEKPGTVLWEFETGSDVASSPAIGSDGTVYVGSIDKKLYAIKTASKGLANSPWPMRGQNPLHTGRVMKK